MSGRRIFALKKWRRDSFVPLFNGDERFIKNIGITMNKLVGRKKDFLK